jgi:hypothetical protein
VAVNSAIGSSDLRRINSAVMNPRYRRMVIPGALVALILIAVVASVVKG